MKTDKLFMLLGCIALFLAACAPNTVINPTPVSQLDQQARSYEQAPKEYVIEVGDTLDIKFMYNAELNELSVPVRPDGRISLQLAHDVPAAGVTPTQLRNVLSEKFAVELKKPEIAVIVRTFGGQKIFVDGEVSYPGPIDFKGRLTLFQALSQARGLRETARLSNIIVIRKDFEGKPMAANIDLRKVINGTDLSQDIALMPYDIVYVPKSQIANYLKFVDEYINRAVPGGFPGFAGFANPYAYAFGGFTKVYPDTGASISVAR
jgi:polysaccharide export outer membrane protein